MKKDPFKVSVDDKYQFDIQPEEVKQLDVVPNDENSFHILHEGKSFQVSVLESDYANRSYVLQVDGIKFTVSISDYYERLVKKLGLTIGASHKMNTLLAPMPGLIVDILVAPGDEVKKDDPLLILEAMKMENVIKAAGDGTVKSISTQKGQSVDKGHILIAFE